MTNLDKMSPLEKILTTNQTLPQQTQALAETDSQQFAQVLTEENLGLLKKENSQKVMKLTYNAMQTIESVNKASALTNIQQTIDEMKKLTLELKNIFGDDQSLVNVEEIEDLKLTNQNLTTETKKFASIAYSIISMMPAMSSASSEQSQKANVLLTRIEQKLDTITFMVEKTEQLQSSFSDMNFAFNQNAFSDPRYLSLQLEQSLSNSIVSIFKAIGDEDDDSSQSNEDIMKSILGNTSQTNTNSNGLNPDLLAQAGLDPNQLNTGIF